MTKLIDFSNHVSFTSRLVFVMCTSTMTLATLTTSTGCQTTERPAEDVAPAPVVYTNRPAVDYGFGNASGFVSTTSQEAVIAEVEVEAIPEPIMLTPEEEAILMGEDAVVFEPVIEPAVVEPTPEPVLISEPITQRKYKIQKGDSLWKIAEREYGDPMRWTEIRDANPNLNLKRLQIGTEITLP